MNISHFKHLIMLLMILAVLVILGGKLLFNPEHQNSFLFFYGIVVTSAIFLLFSVRYFFYRDPYDVAQERLRADPNLHRAPLVSIMVAVHNEEDFIVHCVHSLERQTYAQSEVIVVNDASTDKTAAVLDRYPRSARMRIFHLEQNVGKKKALAHAILQARGKIFVFTDSDSVLAPDAVERVVDIFNTHPDVGGVSGHSRASNAPKNLLTKIQDTWYEGQFSVRKAYESVFGAVTCVSGPLACFRREAVFNLVPAWINDRFVGAEFKFATDRTKTALVLASHILGPRIKATYKDSPFITRADYPARFWHVVYSRSARAYTEVPDNVRSFFRQQVRWKKSFLRNIWLTGGFYWQRPLPAALMYYLRALFVFVGPFVVFRHLIWLPLNGNYFSALLYLSGVLFVGSLFALAHRLERPDETVWVYRPLMNFLSTFVLSWFIFYSAATIRNMTWTRH